MIKHVMEPDSSKWDVIDLDTSKRIEGVQFANDETGEYSVVVFDKDGSIKLCICPNCQDSHVLIEYKKGNIKLVRKE